MKRRFFFGVAAVVIAGSSLAQTSVPAADAPGAIEVVTAQFGGRNFASPLDFSARLQKACGPSATYCDAFCTDAFVGTAAARHPHLGVPPVCRVIYRCGGQTTRTAEAAKNETITLNCRGQ